jgi:hypothetical protein
MLVLPLLLMLNQVVRLGTATRERRLAALRLAGATPAEVRRIGAIEVGLPCTVGAAAGPLVFALLRTLLGGQRVIQGEDGQTVDLTVTPPSHVASNASYSSLQLIPTSVTPAWWQTVAVVAVVAAAAVVTGSLASRRLIASPLGVSRRVRRPAPRPWGLLLVGTGLGTLAVAVGGAVGSGRREQVLALAGVLLVTLGAIALAPWVAFRSGQRALGRTSDPATLIAAGHLVSDPRPAGRAAAAVGAIGLVSGVAAVIEADVFLSDVRGGGRGFDPFFVTSFVLLGVALLLVLLVIAGTLAVHAAESIVDRRRVLACLVAAGTPVQLLRDALRQEAMLTALPLSFAGVVIGAVVTSAADPALTLAGILLLCVQVTATVALTWVAIHVAIRAVAPRLLVASAPANLRTE